MFWTSMMRGFRKALLAMGRVPLAVGNEQGARRDAGPGRPGAAARAGSLRVELDDERLVDGRRELGALRPRLELPLQRLHVHLEPLGMAAALRRLRGGLDAQLVLGLLRDLDQVAGAAH